MISQEFSSEKIRKRSRRRVSRPTTATNDEQQNVDRNYAVINLETYTHTHTHSTHIYTTSRTHNPPFSYIVDREREREERKTRKAALSHQQQKHTNGGRANAHIPPAPDGAACFTGGWGFLYLAVGTVRRSRVYTRRLAALCMFAVAEENLNQLPPPIYPPYLCLPLSLSLCTPSFLRI